MNPSRRLLVVWALPWLLAAPLAASDTARVRSPRPAGVESGHLLKVLGSGYLGVGLVELTPELRKHFGAPEDRGVMVSRVEPDSPAAKAGLQVGDVITRVDEAPVIGYLGLRQLLAGRAEDPDIALGVVREGRELELAAQLQVGRREQLDLGEGLRWRIAQDGEPRLLGEGWEKVNPEVMKRLERSLEGLDWERFSAQLEPRRQELSSRLAQLEKRLAELEKLLAAAQERERR